MITGADIDTVGTGTTSLWYTGAPGAEPPPLVGDENCHKPTQSQFVK